MELELLSSKETVEKAIKDYKPYAICLALSGGDDSLTAYQVAKTLDINIDFIIHCNTRTGIQETTNFVRQFSACSGCKYLECDAKDKYEKYVLRKGFFGRGIKAHTYAYHTLKQQHLQKTLSKYIRQRKKGRYILLLNGARKEESNNRKHNLVEPFNPDKASPKNVWVNIIHEWSKLDCIEFLEGQKVKRNPVTEILHRSGECMCGTMQSLEARREAAFWFPGWGKWLDDLEQRVLSQGFYWRWGENIPKSFTEKKNGQLDIFDYLPMCQGCQLEHSNGT